MTDSNHVDLDGYTIAAIADELDRESFATAAKLVRSLAVELRALRAENAKLRERQFGTITWADEHTENLQVVVRQRDEARNR